jgi:acetylornithine aminotransferase
MALMNNYGERTTTLVKGDGPYLWDDQDRRYLDALSGIAVCGLGHNHPAVTEAICEQAGKLLHVSNLYHTQPQQALAEALVKVSGMDKIFFANSGAEANECAIKIARKYGNDKGITAPHIITADGSFHGRTMATLTATGNPKVKEAFLTFLIMT